MPETDDGAHLGWSAETGMQAALGGEQPKKKGRSPEEMRDFLAAAPFDTDGYDETANACGRVFLEFFQRHPECEGMSAEGKYEWPNGWDQPHVVVRESVDDYMKRVEPETRAQYGFVFEELTGFMYGWAVNAARYAMGWGPVSNPAIVEVNL